MVRPVDSGELRPGLGHRIDLGELGALRSPGILGPRLQLPVTRPRDHLVLGVTAAGCEVVVDEDHVPWLVPSGPDARLVVLLPPQHLHEQVYQQKQGNDSPAPGQPEQPVLPAGARFSESSRFVYALGDDDTVELTTAGILRAMSGLPLSVVPLAEPRFVWRLRHAPVGAEVFVSSTAGPLVRAGALAASRSAARSRTSRILTAAHLGARILDLAPGERELVLATDPAERIHVVDRLQGGLIDNIDALGPFFFRRPQLRPPDLAETSLEVPTRLILSPSPRGGWAHSIDVDPTPGATVELWNTRLGVLSGDGGAPTVDETSSEQRIVRAVWTRDLDPGADTDPTFPFRTALTPKNRMDLVELSTGDAGTAWALPPPAPITVNTLALTALGASIDVRGHWDVQGVPLVEWQHRTTLGRDQFVRVVEKGYLCPFGHRAVKITETRRRADPTLPRGDHAILWQRHFIILREQVRTYGDRDMPFVQVTVDPKVTPDLNDPGADAEPFWPRVDLGEFRFQVTAVDQDGIEHRYDTPLLFVPERREKGEGSGHPTDSEVRHHFALTSDGSADDPGSGFLGLARHVPGGRRLAMAPKGTTGDAAYEARTLRFTVDPAIETCTPRLLYADLVVPAMAATSGQKTPLRLGYAPAYTSAGFGPGNVGEVVLVATEPAAPLSFGSTDRTGGFLDPGQHVAGIARATGPVSDVAAAVAGAAADPASLFSGLGKILGLFELSDVLGNLGLADVPAYVSQVLDPVSAITGALDRAAALLAPAAAAASQLQSAATKLDALMDATPPPSAAAFASYLTELRTAVTDALEPPVLASLGMAEAALAERALRTIAMVTDPPGGLFDPAALLEKLAAGLPVANALDHVHLEWRPPLQQWPAGPTGDAIFLPGRPDGLLLAVDVRGGDLVAEPSVEVVAQLSDFTLQLVPGMALVHLPFKRLYFRASTGKKTEIDVDLGDLEWLGALGFVDRLRQLIPLDGFSDPPQVAVDDGGISAGFTFNLPNVAVGVFNLSNLSMAADVRLPFLGESPSVGFSFCSRERPFTVAVLFMGGGGFLGLRLTPRELVLLEASVEFGATLALDFGVASGSVSCMAGVYLRLEAGDGSLTGYLRIRGEVDVLGLITASIEMYMGLTYEFGSGKVVGKAKITVEVEVLFFSASVSIKAERRFAGSKGDPTFADALGPYAEPDCPWTDYCQAFAEV